MASSQALQIPEVGHAVRVRNRLATVRAVEPYESREAQGRLHIVEVEYLDDCRFPEAEQLLWEIEATAKVLGTTSLPGVDAQERMAPADILDIHQEAVGRLREKGRDVRQIGTRLRRGCLLLAASDQTENNQDKDKRTIHRDSTPP
jgi:hypothetical protein